MNQNACHVGTEANENNFAIVVHPPPTTHRTISLDDNLPFDQFTIESLAGDLLPNPSASQKVLSGFNRLHRSTDEGGSDPEDFRVVYAFDRTNITAAAWMGITLGCAQCHDHKYDPLSQQKYYQFLAFFNSLKGEIPVRKVGAPNPPQIQVVGPEEQLQIDQLNHHITQIDDQLRKRDDEVKVAFTTWLRKTSVAHAEVQPDKTAGAIGGTIARSSVRAYYADTKLAGDLTLKTAIHSSGRVTVAKAVDNEVAVFHFDRSATKGLPESSSHTGDRKQRALTHMMHSDPFHAFDIFF